MSYYIGIDLGTTHIKTGVFDAEGRIVKLSKSSTPLTRCGDESFYKPATLVSIVEAQLAEALKEYPLAEGIGITGMAEAGLVINRNNRQELTDILPWFDKRTVSYAKEFTAEDEQFFKTGLRNSFKYGIYKLLWCLEHYSIDRGEALWLSVCDYLHYKLTGSICTDPTFAARTYAYNIRAQEWDTEILSSYGLDAENFPVVNPSGAYSGYLHGTKIPVAICGHDHICSAAAIVKGKNRLCNSCGTAEAYIGVLEALPVDIDEAKKTGLVYGPFVDGASYFGMANLPSSGQSLEWVRKQIQSKEVPYNRINELLAGLPQEVGELLYYPYLSGMGSPLFYGESSGAFLGLKPQHGLAEMLRAVIEGTAYHSRWMLDAGFCDDITEIVVSGGVIENRWWMQCKADILNREIITTSIQEGTLYGAVALLRLKNERYEMTNNIQKESYTPDGNKARVYSRIYNELFLPYAQIVSRFTLKSLSFMEYSERNGD